MSSFGLSLSSGRSKQIINGKDDDIRSVTTCATEPLKCKESCKMHRATGFIHLKYPRSREINETNSVSNESTSDERNPRNSNKQESLSITRALSFQGLRKKFEKISWTSIHRQQKFKRHISVLDGHDLSSCDETSEKAVTANLLPQRSSAPTQLMRRTRNQSMQNLKRQLSMNSDRQDELFSSLLEGTAGCVTTEAQLESRLKVGTMALHHDSICGSANSLHHSALRIYGTKTLSEEATGFLAVVKREMEATTAKKILDEDDLIIFLGAELESSTCEILNTSDKLGHLSYSYEFNDNVETKKSVRKAVTIEDAGPVEELLETIEKGYEASLIGCGMIGGVAEVVVV